MSALVNELEAFANYVNRSEYTGAFPINPQATTMSSELVCNYGESTYQLFCGVYECHLGPIHLFLAVGPLFTFLLYCVIATNILCLLK